ncbi:hypothetical protein [Phytoactinopolyspora limicola]|uniref:hypothetical protein n=1 Tax=Phytoactinopolyspora limicola TaxID=2715536 RepID=UPI0014076497|nr:hypothetical protein [Phytoactinopolyspora limicola]
MTEREAAPITSAVRELYEGTGLDIAELVELRTGPVLNLVDRGGAAWQVHTFRAETLVHRLRPPPVIIGF